MQVSGTIVTPDGTVDGTVRIEGDRIIEVLPGQTDADEHAAWVLPGFVDIHCHGGGGSTFTTGDPNEAREVVAFHRSHGTTTMLASLVTLSRDETTRVTTALAPLVTAGLLAGLHLEGPYLSTARCGAQNPAHLRDPDEAELTALLDLGVVRMVTIAPELPGALAAIGLLARRGTVAAIGHTDATYEQARAGIDAGATVATHLANAMRPIHHRDPGPILALLDAPGVTVEQIADGVHLHDGMLTHVLRTAGADRVALVTDALSSAGMPDGDYELGGQPTRVTDGVARLAVNGSIAGSSLTLDAALRRAVALGVSLVDAARMLATTPARVLGLDTEVGRVAPGLRADLVLLDESLHITSVVHAGTIHGAP